MQSHKREKDKCAPSQGKKLCHLPSLHLTPKDLENCVFLNLPAVPTLTPHLQRRFCDAVKITFTPSPPGETKSRGRGGKTSFSCYSTSPLLQVRQCHGTN